uniref:DDE-1 domain-containing protein n=1 Tax=Amphimedon queenslandica TaxID=400682 RepID=A0A1X7V2B2_AMPQE
MLVIPDPLKAKGLGPRLGKSRKDTLAFVIDKKAQLTVLACVSAGGQCLPPMIIYNRKGLGDGMDDGAVPCTLFAFSPKGWIDTELYENWFFHHFLAYCPPVPPLLLLDGHSHCSPTFLHSLAANKKYRTRGGAKKRKLSRELSKEKVDSAHSKFIKANTALVEPQVLGANSSTYVTIIDKSYIVTFCILWSNFMINRAQE